MKGREKGAITRDETSAAFHSESLSFFFFSVSSISYAIRSPSRRCSDSAAALDRVASRRDER
ncbi:hypothetical protein PENTCL1PPCAC_1186 [Pristionchus entomophagus]|uniref:Uncharacterized protein n=1 Tax=Pristionchus entomophagus TaxID=358040 RepID=A0AAV5SH72_9BILA|nr:hypothetical protein PENTCL1PPCAC_1186 [Pristionchus entomophagus]